VCNMYIYICIENFELAIFAVSAVDYQKLTGVVRICVSVSVCVCV